MRFTINNPKSWLAAVSRQYKVTTRWAALPILDTIKISASGSLVELESTDLDTWGFQEYREVTVDGADGTVCVPRTLLKDIATKMKGSRWVTVSSVAGEVMFTDNQATTLTARTLPVADFPKARDLSGPTFSLPFDPAPFHTAAIAASTDDARPVLTGVALDSDEGMLRWVATDSYRLAYNSLGLADDGLATREGGHAPLLPAKPVIRLVPAYTGANTVLLIDRYQAAFAGDQGILVVRLIEGTFPNYKTLLRTTHAGTIRATAAEWHRGISAVETVAEDHIPVRITTVEAGWVMMSATRQDVGGVETRLEGATSDFDQVIAFNTTYLDAGIKWAEGTGADEVALSVLDPLKPGQIEVGDSMYLLMPVRL